MVYVWMFPLCNPRIRTLAAFVTHASEFMKPSTTWRSNHAMGVEMQRKMILCVMNWYTSSM